MTAFLCLFTYDRLSNSRRKQGKAAMNRRTPKRIPFPLSEQYRLKSLKAMIRP
jgi:hypothetical protein